MEEIENKQEAKTVDSILLSVCCQLCVDLE